MLKFGVLREVTPFLKSAHIYANCGSIAVIASMTYMTIVDLFDEYPAPFSPEMTMIVIGHDTNIYIE